MTMDDDHVPVRPFFNFTLPSSIITPPKEDDSWLDKEIEEEEDAQMKEMLIGVKRTMKLLDNETKRNFIFEERKRVVEREQYANEINSTQGFEVGEYPYMSRQACNFITRYYCPPDITITDYELDKLTSFANLAIDKYNITQNTEFGNVLVIKAMRCFSGGGHYYYLTFQASLPDHPPQMFEARLYDAPHWVSPPVTIQFVRLKMHQPN